MMSPSTCGRHARCRIDARSPLPSGRRLRSHVDVDAPVAPREPALPRLQPQVAADAWNTLAQLYIEQSLELRFPRRPARPRARSRSGSRSGTAKVDAAEKALQEYREREGLVEPGGTAGLVAREARLRQGRPRRAHGPSARSGSTTRSARTGPARSRASRSCSARRSGSSARRLALSRGTRPTRRHGWRPGPPDIVRLAAQIRSTQEKIRAEMRDVARAAESEYRHGAREGGARLAASLEAVRGEARTRPASRGALERDVGGARTTSSTRTC